MGQIVAKSAKPKRCNIQAIQSGGSLYSSVLKSGEYMLVSSDNSMDTSGNGLFDSYVIGDGVTTCNNLILHALIPELEDKADKANTYTKSEVNNLIPSVDNDIIIGALPSSGVPNTIYRVPGTNSYTDYAWDGTQFVELGTFTGNGDIDATPTENSTNPVQSGGVYPIVENLYGKSGTLDDPIYAYFDGKYINGTNTRGLIYNQSGMSLAYVKVEKGITYNIVFEKTYNNAGYLLGYTPVPDGSSIVSVLTDYGKGTNAAATIEWESTYTGYLAMGYATGYALPVVTHTGVVKGIGDKVEDLYTDVYGEETNTNIPLYYDAVGKYISNAAGKIASYSSLSLAYYPIEEGKTYHIDWPATCNNAGYLLGYASAADGSTAVTTLTDYGMGDSQPKVWVADLTSTFTGYLAIGYNSGAVQPIVKETASTKGIEEKVGDLESSVGQIKDQTPLTKSIMFFGDSLTAASSVGIVGFAEIIADKYGMPYRAFVTDSGDGNTADVPVNYPCWTNYAKDGTKLYIDSSRPKPDSVVERVKRHITASTNVDTILIECTINDEAHIENKGTISDSYTATYDTTTTIGALEEICRYLTTLGTSFKIGFYIPWQFSWQVSLDYFDAHIEVLKKWGLPYLDLRESAGFNMKGCVAHRIYSMSSDDVASYSATTTYNTNDECKYAGQIYVCGSDNVVGIEPTDTTIWTMRASVSRDGTHLNNIGHEIVWPKICEFLKSI